MTIRERVVDNLRHLWRHKRQYASYGLIMVGVAGLLEHLLVYGYSWDVYQHVTCHGFWLGIVPILVGFLIGARWKTP